MRIIEETTTDKWGERERYWIAHHRSLDKNLANHTDGGEGHPPGIPNPNAGRHTKEATPRSVSLSLSVTPETARAINTRAVRTNTSPADVVSLAIRTMQSLDWPEIAKEGGDTI